MLSRSAFDSVNGPLDEPFHGDENNDRRQTNYYLGSLRHGAKCAKYKGVNNHLA